MLSYNIVLLGDGGVGKTAWIRRMRTDTFQPQYFATVGSEVHPFGINTNYGHINLDFYDCAGQEKYASHLPDIKSDATILMFDLTSRISYKNLKYWRERCKEEPVFVAGNKCDIKQEDIKVQPKFHRNYLALSAKRMTTRDLLTPILRVLTGYDNIEILHE
jgi:GTP-binding nuclear protein Ran